MYWTQQKIEEQRQYQQQQQQPPQYGYFTQQSTPWPALGQSAQPWITGPTGPYPVQGMPFPGPPSSSGSPLRFFGIRNIGNGLNSLSAKAKTGDEVPIEALMVPRESKNQRKKANRQRVKAMQAAKNEDDYKAMRDMGHTPKLTQFVLIPELPKLDFSIPERHE